MPVAVKVPPVGDSILAVTIGVWKKSVGQAVATDESVVELESEKSTFEVPAPSGGVITQLLKQPGEEALIGEVIAYIDESAAPAPKVSAPAATPPAAAQASAPAKEPFVMPAAARAMAESGVQPGQVTPTGPGNRILKEDVQRTAAIPAAPAVPAKIAPVAAPVTTAVATTGTPSRAVKRQLMTPIRRRIAERLLEAQSNAALLTTFNEVDMSGAMALRKQYQDSFVERFGVKLGFMSIFVKATVDALQQFPNLNAEIQGNEIITRNYVDMGIAVGGGKGLVVPILRNAEQMTFAQIEQTIGELAKRAQNNSLKPEELTGGTFTISNGGVYGSLLSTPIVNPPQSGVLGMHAIQDRPVVRDGQIVIRPMMYLALTYDHRIVDGREAVTFLKRIKDCIENPVRLMLEI